MAHDKIITSTRRWLEKLVIGLNLCPFAARELANERVRFVVSDAATETQLLECLRAELQWLENTRDCETTLLIHPRVLQDFYDFNDFLDVAEKLLCDMQLAGVYQLASFHPHYQFAGTAVDDVENYTNRSPFPILHLLREDSVEKAIAATPDVTAIPARNIALMNSMGREKITALLASCYLQSEKEL